MMRAGGAVLSLLAVGAIAPAQSSEAPDKPPTPKEVEIKSGGENDCSTFRHMKNGRFFGIACASRGDRSIPVGSKQEYKRWSYSLIYIKKDGTFKCGYIRHVLPKLKNIHVKREYRNKSLYEGASYCVGTKKEVKSPTRYLYRHNCGQKKNGKDKCSDGSFTKIDKSCDGLERRSYGNFTPRGPKPHFLNVFGAKDKKALTFLRSKNLHVTGVLHRFGVKRSGIEKGKKFKTVVVRTKAIDENIGWSYMRKKCVEWDD